MLTTQQLTNLRVAAIEAVHCEKESLAPAELLVAQWAEESGWGMRAPGFNCFGIKHYPGAFGQQRLYTHEVFTPQQADEWKNALEGRSADLPLGSVPDTLGRYLYACHDWFATFPRLSACFEKRSKLFFQGKYGPLMAQFKKSGDVIALINGIAPIYATDPDYANDLIRLVSMPEVISAIKLARTAE